MATILLPKTLKEKQAHYDNAMVQLKLQPGDIIELEGDYLFVTLYGLQGTPDKPILIRTRGKATIGGHKSYTIRISGSHYKILPDPGMLVIGKPGVYSMGINTFKSTNYEIGNVELYNVTTGIQQNPEGPEVLENIYLHDLFIHDMNNPDEKGRSEGFYMGKTSAGGCTLKNVRIENNRIENITGDGIQAGLGTYVIKGNKISGFAKAKLQWQNNGITIGGGGTAQVEDNIIENGFGVAFQNMGQGNQTFKRNIIRNNNSQDVFDFNGTKVSGEDIVFLGFRGAGTIDFSDNVFENNKAATNKNIVRNASGSNLVGVKYVNNKGLADPNVTKGTGDTFKAYTEPVVVTPTPVVTPPPVVVPPVVTPPVTPPTIPTPTPPPSKTLTKTIKVYSDGSVEVV